MCLCKQAQSWPMLCDSMGSTVDCSPAGSSVLGLSRQAYWSGLPFPPPGALPGPGMEPPSPAAPALAGRLLPCSPPRSVKFRQMSISRFQQKDPVQNPKLRFVVRPPSVWKHAKVFPSLSHPGVFWRWRVCYFVICPRIWACLLFPPDVRFRLCVFGRKITVMLPSPHCNVSGDLSLSHYWWCWLWLLD